MRRPDGWFVNDMLIFNALDRRGWAAKGFELFPVDTMNVPERYKTELKIKLINLLRGIRVPGKVQFQWSVNSDYRDALLKYKRDTEQLASNEWSKFVREDKFQKCWDLMLNRQLRKEKLVVYYSVPIEAKTPFNLNDAELHDHFTNVLSGLASTFANFFNVLKSTIGPVAMIKPFTDQDHYNEYIDYFNPSLLWRKERGAIGTLDLNRTIQENCFNSEIMGNSKIKPDFGFFMDGNYYGILVIKRWPQTTLPGLINQLTSMELLDYRITMNIQPIDILKEKKQEEKELGRLKRDYRETGKESLRTTIAMKEQKIARLSEGFTLPMNVEFIITAWAHTKEALVSKLTTLKAQIHYMNGAEYFEANIPTTTTNLFFQTAPGWVFGSYNKHALYAENEWVADMIPFSATFTGHLAKAEALYDGDNFNLVGVCNFLDGMPQHATMFGMSGAGKSAAMTDLLSQTEPFYGYTILVEEGLSYGIYTKTMGTEPLVIHPDTTYTINYLDTEGLPLSSIQLANAALIASQMCGNLRDEERQSLRTAQLGQYIERLYDNTYEDWIIANADRKNDIAKMAYAVEKWRQEVLPAGGTYIEAWNEFNTLHKGKIPFGYDEKTGKLVLEKAQEIFDGITEGDITRFMKTPKTSKLVRNASFAYFNRQDYPTHSILVNSMMLDNLPQHDPEAINKLVTLLAAWQQGGQYGQLFDGSTNIDLKGNIAHFELGNIPESAEIMKKMASFIINNYTRNHVLTLDRGIRKRYIFEEAGRLLDVNGGEKIIAEGYGQLRKFNTWIISITQQYSKFKQSVIRPYVMGNSRQHFIMKQNDRGDVEDIAEAIDLPKITQDRIQNFPSPDTLPDHDKFSSMIYYHLDSARPICGTIRNYCSKEMLYVSSSTGENFDKRARELALCKDVIQGIKDFSKQENEK